MPRTTNSGHGLRPCPNLLIEVGTPTAPNQIWVSDLTYLPLQAGNWVYLLAWMDLFSRRIVGWWVDADMKESLLVKAFEQATAQRRPAPGLVVHSDRGGQYFGKTFRQRLQAWQCRQSMAGADNPYENAHAESLWSRLKAELSIGAGFESLVQARSQLFEYIEAYYNTRRLHSALGYRSPVDFEQQFYQTFFLQPQQE